MIFVFVCLTLRHYTTGCRAISCWTLQHHYTLFFHPQIPLLEPVLSFSWIKRCQSCSTEVFATEPLTCQSGHWCPINEKSVGDPHTPTTITTITPKRLWREAGEPSLCLLGCSSLRKTAIVTTSLPQAALLRNCLICLFQTVTGILLGIYFMLW